MQGGALVDHVWEAFVPISTVVVVGIGQDVSILAEYRAARQAGIETADRAATVLQNGLIESQREGFAVDRRVLKSSST